ncbi:MAG: metallophosphoesterase family protein [Steroidobacteraceae bacterium]
MADTHGLLRPEALAFLGGCSLIIHAGDIGEPAILDALGRIAPVIAVRGNNDTQPWAGRLKSAEFVQVGAVLVYAIHDRAQIGTDLRASGVRVVVCGHSHQPRIEECGGLLFVNPGSAGPRRFKLPVTMGELRIEGAAVSARITDLLAAAGPRHEPAASLGLPTSHE